MICRHGYDESDLLIRSEQPMQKRAKHERPRNTLPTKLIWLLALCFQLVDSFGQQLLFALLASSQRVPDNVLLSMCFLQFSFGLWHVWTEQHGEALILCFSISRFHPKALASRIS